MPPDILILGQGLAGTLLGWELERAGIAFAIADPGSDAAASRVAAGIVNPITGRRLVQSAGVDTLLPIARETYRELETTLGVSLWRDLRVRRLFRDDRERRVGLEKQASGELAPSLGPVDEAGFWIEGAGCVDLPALLTSSRRHWERKGCLWEERLEPAEGLGQYARVIDCRGVGGAGGGPFDFVPWQFSKGEILEVAVEGLDFGHVLNDGHWVLPVRIGVAWMGATHEPGVIDRQPTAAGREVLEAAARRLLARPFRVLDHRAGVRVNLPDKMPVVGVHPREARLGLINGLGAKGVLLAPALARQWVGYLTQGTAFDPGFDVGRFAVGK